VQESDYFFRNAGSPGMENAVTGIQNSVFTTPKCVVPTFENLRNPPTFVQAMIEWVNVGF
jgi:hypothetical protein